jgi:hypothetical protein
MAPGAAQPLHGMPHIRVAGKRPQRIQHVVQSRAPQPVQQRARVLQHDPRLAALGQQLGDELAHPLVAPLEHRRVVVVAEVGMLQHPLQVADRGRRAQVRSPRRDQRLVHVQRDRERAVDAGDVHRPRTDEYRLAPTSSDRRLDRLFPTAQVRQTVDILGQLSHDPSSPRQGSRLWIRPPGTVIAALEAMLGEPPAATYPGAVGFMKSIEPRSETFIWLRTGPSTWTFGPSRRG